MTTATTPTRSRAKFSVSPSRLARAFELSCDRRLRLELTRAEHIPEPWASVLQESKRAEAESATTQCVFKSGYDWEERALSSLVAPAVLVAPPGEGPVSERRWAGFEESLSVIAEAQAGQLLYQLELKPPLALYRQLGLDPNDVQISNNFPDLIQVLAEEDVEHTARDSQRAADWLEGRSAGCDPEARVFRVIDLKRSARVKTSHQIQTLFYALELQHILNEANIPGRVDLSWGGVWLGDTPSPEYVRVDALLPYFERMARGLPELLQRPISDASWSLQTSCEWCPFQPECARQARDEDHVTRLAGITPRAVEFLGELGVSTLPQLKSLLAQPDADDTLARCATLEGKKRRLSARVEAYERGRAVPVNSTAAQIPRFEEVRIFLTAHREAVAFRPWALGMRIAQRNPHLDLEGQPELTRVYVAHDESESAEIALEWSAQLCGYLKEIDTMNQGRRWADQVSLQLYCYSALERRMIIDLLIEQLDDPRSHPRLGELVAHLQGPSLLQRGQHPARLSETPIVTLLSELGSLMTLPIDKVYTLSEVSALLKLRTSYPRQPDLHYPYGHQLRSDFALERWGASGSAIAGADAGLKRCAVDIETRLKVYDELLYHIRGTHRDDLVRWPARFTFPEPSRIDHPKLSKLAYLSALDTRANREETRDLRFAPHAELVERGQLITLKANSDDSFTVTRCPLGVALTAGGYGSFLLVEESPEGLKAAASFVDDDVTRGWGNVNRKTEGVRHVDVDAIKLKGSQHSGNITGDLMGAELRLSGCGSDELQVKRGGSYVLLPRYKSHQLGQLESCLQTLDQGHVSNRLFLELLDDPQSAQRALPFTARGTAPLEALKARAQLTPSQQKAWDHAFSQRVTAIWGPPGTGKTHLLASLIVSALDVARQEGRSCHIYVSAMTHTAIEHLMTKCAQRLGELTPESKPALVKLGSWDKQRPRLDAIKVINKKDLSSVLNQHRFTLIGGTQWALNKLDYSPFDVMVIDEASQVLVSHAALGLSRLAQRGRLIVAGDHMQLGPILSEDARLEGDESYLSGSVLDLIRDRAERPGVKLSQLLENWRMNRALTQHSQLIYGSEYQCASEAVAARQLHPSLSTSLITPEPEATDRLYRAIPEAYHTPELRALFDDPRALLSACLDPTAPLTIATLEGLEVGRSNPIEAALIALIAHTLRLNREREETRELRSGRPRDDQSFWRDEVFMISPHHSQLETLRGLYGALSSSPVPPFAQTVDKAQGQEADTLLITYGVSDLDYAQSESSFIYDINRLNVSITRARAKVVVCLPEPLIRGSAQLINDPHSSAGLSYMQHLERRAQEGHAARFELGGGRALMIHSV